MAMRGLAAMRGLSLPARGAWIEIRRAAGCGSPYRSLPARGAWIEISTGSRRSASIGCRSPQGERGLKSFFPRLPSACSMSLPARGAWIEIWLCLPARRIGVRRSPQGERGLKSQAHAGRERHLGRSPQGERGLKSAKEWPDDDSDGSLPARGAWIEIVRARRFKYSVQRRSPQGERGLKY